MPIIFTFMFLWFPSGLVLYWVVNNMPVDRPAVADHADDRKWKVGRQARLTRSPRSRRHRAAAASVSSASRVPVWAPSPALRAAPPRRAPHFTRFLDEHERPIDEGILLTSAAPASFTGEDVLELQGHGGPVVMQMLLERCLQLGARLAEPGEFTRRAFLNGKLDLAQAEASPI